MPYTINNHCTQCGICAPECPTGAIQTKDQDYWIDPALCNNCATVAGGPQCVAHCPIETPPSPLQVKKGRWKESDHTSTSPDLFLNGKTNSFASAIVVWEGCNLLAQRQSLPWQQDDAGAFYYERQVKQGRGRLRFWLREEALSLSAPGSPPSPPCSAGLHPPAAQPINTQPTSAKPTSAKPTSAKPTSAHTSTAQPDPEPTQSPTVNFDALDIRSACLHLIYAAHAFALDHPWEQTFVIRDRQIEQYLGLDKRRDLTILRTKLSGDDAVFTEG
ncbi:4Fe-4S binding protein [Alkalinema pantanalense CENA528]|uniref:4Fe-4S binding protein n=1 Tax=Alkalinema pantanalense TaxID=1620705 RepID=UPI003D6F61D8